MSEPAPPVPAEPQVHRADPALRRRMLAAVALMGTALAALGWWFKGYLDDLPMDSVAQVRDSAARPLAAVTEGCGGVALLLLLYGMYLLQRCGEVRRAPRYPGPQMRLMHDMRVLEGPAKRRYAQRLLRQGLLCLGLGAGLFGAAWYWRHLQVQQFPALKFDSSRP